MRFIADRTISMTLDVLIFKEGENEGGVENLNTI